MVRIHHVFASLCAHPRSDIFSCVFLWIVTANFGGFEWSPDERMIAYVAEPKPNTGLSFFASAADQMKEPNKVKVTQGNEEEVGRGCVAHHGGRFAHTLL
jgi:hypothetical protein